MGRSRSDQDRESSAPRRRSPDTVRRAILATGDGLLLFACFLLAYYLRFGSGWVPAPKGVPAWDEFLGTALLMTGIGLWALHWTGLYTTRHTTSPVEEIYKIIVGVAVGAVGNSAVSFLTHVFWYSRLVLALTAALAGLALPSWHVLIRALVERRLRRGLDRQRVAIVGANLAGMALAERMRVLGSSHEIAGFLTGSPADPGLNLPAPVLGTAEALPELAARHQLAEVWVAPLSVDSATGLQLVADLGVVIRRRTVERQELVGCEERLHDLPGAGRIATLQGAQQQFRANHRRNTDVVRFIPSEPIEDTWARSPHGIDTGVGVEAESHDMAFLGTSADHSPCGGRIMSLSFSAPNNAK